jgi:cobyrinic acid a,c-diamide synthase
LSCLIAAPCSGSGKTLLSLSLAALGRRRGERVQTFKVGPDYLDSQLLGQVAGSVCRNLDPLLCGEDWVRSQFQWHAARADRVLVEGVMGLFDGRGPTPEGSSAHVAQLLNLPVVLVVEASRQASSVAALVRGFRDHGPPRVRLAGVVLNRVGSQRHRALLKEALAAIDVSVLGVLPTHPAFDLPSRHLGLLPPHELTDLLDRMEQWSQLAEDHLEMDRLWPLLAPTPSRHADPDPIRAVLDLSQGVEASRGWGRCTGPVLIAQDAAFHFLYPETVELLEALGLAVQPWSPLADEPLPADCRAVLLPGGYPELHAPALAAAQRSRTSLAAAHRRGVPIVAECGGLLFLGQTLVEASGASWPMAGVLPFEARIGDLSLGYRQARVQRDGLLVRAGERFGGHEFHRWHLRTAVAREAGSSLWQLEGWGVERNLEGWTTPTLHASWLHLHWAGFPKIPWRLAAAAAGAGPRLSAAFSPRRTPQAPSPSRNAGA